MCYVNSGAHALSPKIHFGLKLTNCTGVKPSGSIWSRMTLLTKTPTCYEAHFNLASGTTSSMPWKTKQVNIVSQFTKFRHGLASGYATNVLGIQKRYASGFCHVG